MASTSSSTSNPIDFGELQECSEIVNRVNNLHSSIDSIEKIISLATNPELISTLNQDESVKLDLFLAYSLNSLFWMYLRTQGIDPNKHTVKSELERIKTYLNKAKQINDRKTMPRLEVKTVQRFIKSGLWDPNQKKEMKNNKKRKFKEVDQE